MSDAELRELERAARTGDLASSRAFARALERVGDRRRAFHEHCRLARRGDPESVAAIRKAVPLGSARAPFVPVPGVRGRVEVLSHAIPATSLLASDEHVFAIEGDRARRFRAGDLEGEFVEVEKPLALLGRDSLHRDGEDLVLRDGATTLERMAMGPDFPGVRFELEGDRGVSQMRGEPLAGGKNEASFDAFAFAERPGTHVWTAHREHDVRGWQATLDALFVGWSDDAVTLACHDLEDGSLRWSAPGLVPMNADERLVLARDLRARLVGLDARTGKPLWDVDDEPRTTLGPVVLLEVPPFMAGPLLEARDRTDGRFLWRIDFDGIHATLTDDTVYVSTRDADFRVLRGFDAFTGELVLDARLASASIGISQIAPLRGRVLVVADGDRVFEVVPS